MEVFSFAKFADSLASPLAWFKSGLMLVKALILVAVLASPFISFQIGKQKGQQIGFNSGYSQAITDHPPQVYNAPATVNNNPTPKPRAKFGITAFDWTLGVCRG